MAPDEPGTAARGRVEMTAAGPASVDAAALVLGDRLGQGGQGTVHQVRNKRINKSAPDGGWEVVYKEYGPAALPDLDARALDAAVALLGRLPEGEARWLCEKTAWPAVVVKRQGLACGFLMRAVPDRFHFTLRTLAGASTGPRRLATVEYLLNDDTYVAGIGLSVGDRDRLLLLADLAATLDRLHKLGVAVGDVSPKNLLFTLTPRPECFLIDSDAMRLNGTSVLPQAETPDWQIPNGEERATPASDTYKLALLAVRLFARDQATTDPARLARAGTALGDLARASLAPTPATRPTPAAWAEQLTSTAATTTNQPPTGGRKKGAPTAGANQRPPGQPNGPGVATRGPHGPGSPGSGPGRPRTAAATAAGIKQAAGILAGILILVLLIATGHHHHAQSQADTPATDPGWSDTPFPDPGTTSADPYDTGDDLGSIGDPGGDPSDDPSDDPSTDPDTPSPTPTDPIATAAVGDCFDDAGDSAHADLSTTSCTTGTFKVVQVNSDTTDLKSCDGVTDSDESVSSTAYDRVLCLSYLSSGGSSFHASQGDCVFGAPGADEWSTLPCSTGTFKVLAVYHGTTAHSKCENWPHYNQWRTMTVPGNSGLDVLLCLSMQYPDDAGYATRNECLVKSGNTFTNVGSCAKSNVYVSGRTNTYDDPAFCQGDASVWWRSNDYPTFAYTVCWRWR
ncbi:LppU/SCO3897 family protein [Actinacidiphila sp. bgisy144]|uniref:LppU/SCO3897 family protein n=1 Tax=Actinacidiphila sp. bgisy144 TaxID=3413791 RepID=UPI003EC0A73E